MSTDGSYSSSHFPAIYRKKKAARVTASEAVSHVQSGQRIVLPLCCGLPQTLIQALILDHERLKNVELVSGLQIQYPFLAEV